MIPLTRTDWVSYIADRMAPFITSDERVLDFGAGDGKMGEYLARTRGVDVELLDVKNHNKTVLTNRLYDGREIPFAAKSFDSAFAVAVFHHIPKEQHTKLLRQLRQICRKRIIIVEDTPANKLEWVMNCIGDTVVNLPRGIGLAYTYRSRKEWADLFVSMGFSVLYNERIAPWYPLNRTLFVLQT